MKENQLSIQKTKDGSNTLFSAAVNETYHSIHGAIQESQHVFIQNGMHRSPKKELNILEIGFGTGLNAWLTLLESNKTQLKVNYTTIEPYPISLDLAKALDFQTIEVQQNLFLSLHTAIWENWTHISDCFVLQKIRTNLEAFQPEANVFDVIYFDAFSPTTQADLWQKVHFEKLFQCLRSGGFLTTYCAKGQVKRDLKSVGFVVESVPGPPGKREMTLAIKE